MKNLVILAGGKSSRMGSDKVFIDYRGGTFLSNMIREADQVFERIIISGGSAEHTEKIREYLNNEGIIPNKKIELYQDNYQAVGPMGGILTVFEETDVEAFAITAVDSPFANMKVLAYLLSVIDDVASVIIRNPEGELEACIAAYSRKAYALMSTALQEHRRSLVRSLGAENIKAVEFNTIKDTMPELSINEIIFKNINTIDELAEIKK